MPEGPSYSYGRSPLLDLMERTPAKGTVHFGATPPPNQAAGDVWINHVPVKVDWSALTAPAASICYPTFTPTTTTGTTANPPVPESGNEKSDEESLMSALGLVPAGQLDDLASEEAALEALEGRLFELRDQVEVIWIEIGRTCTEIVDKKLYRHRKDENGNYFRTAKAYFSDLDRRFGERGQHFSYTTLNRFIGDFRLFIEGESGVSLTPEEAVVVGKSNLEALAPAVRKLQKEGRGEEAKQLVEEIRDAAIANDGLPIAEVKNAVDEVTGRVMKGLDVEFKDGIFGKKVTRFNLWWAGRSVDLLKQEITEEQAEWLARRLGIKPTTGLV